MVMMFAARLVRLIALAAPLALALQIEAAAQGQPAPAQLASTFGQQQEKTNAWTVGLAAGLIEGASSRPVMAMARVVDDGTNLIVLPNVRLGATEKLFLRGADLVIVNSGACSLLTQVERMECGASAPSDGALMTRRSGG